MTGEGRSDAPLERRPPAPGSAGVGGVVLAVCVGPGGIPKHPVDAARVAELGLEGDAHRYRFHGGARRAVCLFALEDYRRLQRDGVAAEPPGAFGENLLTEGLDYALLRAGDRLAVGPEVVLEIDDVREPCKTLKLLDARFPGLMIGRSGWLCRVVRGGVVRAGDAIGPVEDPAGPRAGG
jgi:MOSC domain-containing protein YiiM